jgi:hypothetical protein
MGLFGKNDSTWLNRNSGRVVGFAGGGLLGGLLGGSMDQEKRQQQDISGQKKALEESLKNIPEYEIPQEATDYLKMLEQTSSELGKTGDIYQESVDIARIKAGMGEAPGSAMARQDIQSSTAQQIQNIKEAGGGGVGALGAIANVGMNEQEALRDLAKTNVAYKESASQGLQSALMGQAGFNSNLLQQQASLKGAGLQTMIGEKGKVQESELNKYLTMTDYQLAQLGVSQQEIENMKNRRVQIASSVIGIIPGVAKMAAGA